jgi:hypothetical protein
MNNKTQCVSPIKLKRIMGEAARLQTSGVFKSEIDTIGHLKVFLVTCVGNDEDSPDYDKDYPIEGTLFELVSGNESRTFDFSSELKSFIKKHLETYEGRPSASIILN